MTTIPDGLPTLSAGPRLKDSGTACVMQYISVLTGDTWTDYPACTNETVSRVAQTVNDLLSDEDRHLIVPFIDRLASAGGTSEGFMEAAKGLLTPYYRAQFEADTGGSEVLFERTIGTYLAYQLTDDVYAGTYDPVTGEGITEPFGPRGTAIALAFLDNVLSLHEEHVKHEVKVTSPEALAEAKRLIETRALINV